MGGILCIGDGLGLFRGCLALLRAELTDGLQEHLAVALGLCAAHAADAAEFLHGPGRLSGHILQGGVGKDDVCRHVLLLGQAKPQSLQRIVQLRIVRRGGLAQGLGLCRLLPDGDAPTLALHPFGFRRQADAAVLRIRMQAALGLQGIGNPAQPLPAFPLAGTPAFAAEPTLVLYAVYFITAHLETQHSHFGRRQPPSMGRLVQDCCRNFPYPLFPSPAPLFTSYKDGIFFKKVLYFFSVLKYNTAIKGNNPGENHKRRNES